MVPKICMGLKSKVHFFNARFRPNLQCLWRVWKKEGNARIVRKGRQAEEGNVS